MQPRELLKKLITIESTNHEKVNEAVDVCKSWLEKHDLDCEIIEYNTKKTLLCTIGTGNNTIVFNGHLDVVSGTPAQFIPIEQAGRLYGRGTADMKAGVVGMMTALIELNRENLPCRVQLQLVTDEETGGTRCSQYLAENGYGGDFVICGEPTQLGIGIQAKGILQLDIEVLGKAAHSSRPWTGENAIINGLTLYQAIQILPFTKEKSSFYDCPSVNLSRIEGGKEYNKVPGKCLISLDIRYLPEQNPQEIIGQIEEAVGHPVAIHALGYPVKTSADNPYVRQLTLAVHAQLGIQPELFGQHGAADARFFAQQGIPAVEFGPIGSDWHGDNEYVDIASIDTYTAILKNFVLNFKVD